MIAPAIKICGGFGALFLVLTGGIPHNFAAEFSEFEGSNRKFLDNIRSIRPPSGHGLGGDGTIQQLQLPIIGVCLVKGDGELPFARRKHLGGTCPAVRIQVCNLQVPCVSKRKGAQTVQEGYTKLSQKVFGIALPIAICNCIKAPAVAVELSSGGRKRIVTDSNVQTFNVHVRRGSNTQADLRHIAVGFHGFQLHGVAVLGCTMEKVCLGIHVCLSGRLG